MSRLTALVEEMRARMAGLEGAVGRSSGLDAPRSRRDLLRLGGAAALGAVGAAALRAVPTMAATGDPVLAGSPNTADATTTLTGTAAASPTLQLSGLAGPDPVLGAKTSDFSQAAFDSTGEPAFPGAIQALGGLDGSDGVDGFASGQHSFGVYGLTDSGTGVTGESNTGTAIYARGSGRIRQDSHTLAAAAYWPNTAPNYNPGSQIDQVRDNTGTLWLSNPASGKWRRASTFELVPTPRRVYGVGVFIATNHVVANIDATTRIPSVGGGPSGLPVGATAAWCSVTTFEPATFSVYPGTPAADPHVGAIAAAAKGLQVVYMMVPLNAAGQFSITNLRASARIYFDVWGYLSQSV